MKGELINMNIDDFPKPYIPEKLPLTEIRSTIIQDQEFLAHIIKAGRKLSEFIGYLQNLPNPEILISSLTLQEAVLSSQIEGTIATIADVVNENTSTETLKNDIVEIENYFNAIQFGHEELRRNPNGFSKYLIKQLHVLLLENNVRGADKTPGMFKTEQNFISNEVLGNFTPLPPFLTDEYVDNLVEYIRNCNEVSELLQAAIIHAQFEMIHPFKDGNGRVGRLLIPLFLYYKKVLPFPIFYISRYFAKNNDSYKLCLSNLSKMTHPNEKMIAWKEWISFFFSGIETESHKHIASAKAIIDLYKEMSSVVGRTEMISLIDILFNKLKAEPKTLIAELKLPSTSIRRELQKLADKGYITRTGSDRKTMYVFTKLVDIIQ